MQKYKKAHKASVSHLGRIKKLPFLKTNRGNFIIYAASYGYLKWKHLELLRRSFSKALKRFGKKRFKLVVPRQIWKSFSKKPLQSRMGKGAGSVYSWKMFAVPGLVLMGLSSYKSLRVLTTIFKKISPKLPIKLKRYYK